MNKIIFLLLLCITIGAKECATSYLDIPRLHFSGQFRADTNTGNNINCNFDLNNKVDPALNWNSEGTNDFEFIKTKITSVIDKNGKEDTNSKLLGAEIFTNEKKSLAKISDFDPPDYAISSLFGLSFGLKINGTKLFVGNWKPSIISNDWWHKVKCTQGPFYPDESVRSSVQSTSKIVDVVWHSSNLISEFKSESQKSSHELQVSITLDSYCCEILTIGRVYGTIGITSSKEPLCIGGERKMVPVDPGLFNFDEDHPCSGYQQEDQKPWTYGAPFKFDIFRKALVVDLSNALPTHFSCTDKKKNTSPLDLGDLHFGYILNDQTKKIKPIGKSIPYLKEDMWRQSGIIEMIITDEYDITNLQNSKLVVFTELEAVNTFNANAYQILFHSGANITLLLQESEFFIRPMEYYMARLEHSLQSTHSFMGNNQDFTLLVTRFGEPVNNTKVSVNSSYDEIGKETHVMPYPYNAVKCDAKTKVTNDTGHVKFNFIVEKRIPIKRHYTLNPNCTLKSNVIQAEYTENSNTYYELPIDGQVYNFYYCVGDECKLPEDRGLFLYRALISILAFSTVIYSSDYEPTWEDDVRQIFEQQHHISHVMRSILDMSNFTEVTLPHNIEMLKYVMSKDSKEAFDTDPGYMPTTRNLSPAKRKMLLKWLEKPCFSKSSCSIHEEEDTSKNPLDPRCDMSCISFASHPSEQDNYFKNLINEEGCKAHVKDAKHLPRALFGSQVAETTLSNFLNGQHGPPVCNLTNLQQQLQQAIQLEFYTIPLYSTTLYSITDRNSPAYQAIRDVVMQEMLHMVQAANILIAIGGKVMIDDPNFAPAYPANGLPGGVLSNLSIHLSSYNLLHVHNTFMGIELPSSLANNAPGLCTIGMFYKEIEQCIINLTDDIFKEPHVNKQVKWPWNTNNLGTVHIINDTDSAKKGIDEIVEQGEGAGPLDPNEIDTGMYAHFYRFEELVCQKRLIKCKDDKDSYAYDGDPIVHDKLEVYPMIDDPIKDSFQANTHCYVCAKAFHRVYRNLLQLMQEVFNGEPEKITEAVDLMETLQVYAKRCISTPYEGTGYNCGPVWDYEWE